VSISKEVIPEKNGFRKLELIVDARTILVRRVTMPKIAVGASRVVQAARAHGTTTGWDQWDEWDDRCNWEDHAWSNSCDWDNWDDQCDWNDWYDAW